MRGGFAIIYSNMRLLSLFVVFNLTLCTTGIYSVTDLFADESEGITTHCHDHEHSDVHGSLQHDSHDLEINATESPCYNCCLEVLPGSNDNGNFNATPAVVALLPFLSTEHDPGKTQFLNSVFTKRPHGPPDIYLLHSSYLL
jgi:hypothetical protein